MNWLALLLAFVVFLLAGLIFLIACIFVQWIFFPEKCRQHRAERKRVRERKRQEKRK